MAIFNVTNTGTVNQPPSAIGDITINIAYAVAGSHQFTIANFTTETTPAYSDPEGDAVETVKIKTLPDVGTLELNAVAVTINQEIPLASITGGLLVYLIDDTEIDGYTDSEMTFDIADDGSSTYSGLTGTVTFVVAAYINLPPDVVGDETINISWNELYPYTSADFTTNTTPAYNDPEADAAAQLKVLSLPATGQLKLSGIPVVVNQIITFVDIAAGNFKYQADSLTTTLYNDPWNFAIADAGSGTFSS